MTTWRDLKTRRKESMDDMSADDVMVLSEEEEDIFIEEEIVIEDDETEVVLEDEEEVVEYEVEYIVVEEEEVIEEDDDDNENHTEEAINTTVATDSVPVVVFDDEAKKEAAPQIEEAAKAIDVSSVVAAATTDVSVAGAVSKEVEEAARAVEEPKTADQTSNEQAAAKSSNQAEDESAPSTQPVQSVQEKLTTEDRTDSSRKSEKPVEEYQLSVEEDVGVAVETLASVDDKEATESENFAPATPASTIVDEEAKEAHTIADGIGQENNSEVDEQQPSASIEAEPAVADPTFGPTDTTEEPKQLTNSVPEVPRSPGKIPLPAFEEKEIGWEKPDWVKQSPLKAKKNKVNLSAGGLSPEKKFEWEKPYWVQAQLKSTGKDVKKGVDLQSPITHVPKEADISINLEANPLYLKPTEKGTAVRLGETLAKPITFINGKEPSSSFACC